MEEPQRVKYLRKEAERLFKKAIALLANHPAVGRRTDIDNVRVKLVKDYLIFYEETETHLVILTIWDNRRDPEKLNIK